jgi:hypothetical protein
MYIDGFCMLICTNYQFHSGVLFVSFANDLVTGIGFND